MHDNQIDKLKLELTAGILNNEREAEIYDWLALTVPEYGNKPFNKRFETWINKQAEERFGTKTIENWGMNGEAKTYPQVWFTLTKDPYPLSDVPKFEFSFRYEGKMVGYDYGTKKAVMRDHTESEKLFGIKGITDIVEWCGRVSANRRENVLKMQDNNRNIKKLLAHRDKLKELIDAHNESISYIIRQEVGIK